MLPDVCVKRCAVGRVRYELLVGCFLLIPSTAVMADEPPLALSGVGPSTTGSMSAPAGGPGAGAAPGIGAAPASAAGPRAGPSPGAQAANSAAAQSVSPAPAATAAQGPKGDAVRR